MAEEIVKLESSDKEIFEVNRNVRWLRTRLATSDATLINASSPTQVAEQSVTIKCMLEDTGADAPVPLLNVNSKILAKVVEYCKQHAPAEGVDNARTEELKTWDAEFVKVDQSTLFELILVRWGRG